MITRISRALMYLVLVVCFLNGCSTTPSIEKARNTYSEGGSRLVDSEGQFDHTNIYPYTFDDVFDATYEAIFRNGFSIEKEDRDEGIIMGHIRKPHIFSGGSNLVSFTVYASVSEISDKPRTELKLLLDTHHDIFYGSGTVWLEKPEQKYGSEIVSEIQKIISTFQ